MKIKVNDKVKIVAGKDKGKEGLVTQVFPKLEMIVVDGVNKMVKHLRSNRQGEKGQKIDFFGPIHVSNAMIICPKTKKPTRIGSKLLDDGKKQRVSIKSKEIID